MISTSFGVGSKKLVSRAIFGGLGHAVREMLGMMACYERWNAATESDT